MKIIIFIKRYSIHHDANGKKCGMKMGFPRVFFSCMTGDEAMKNGS
jgi:hypothetical protein